MKYKWERQPEVPTAANVPCFSISEGLLNIFITQNNKKAQNVIDV